MQPDQLGPYRIVRQLGRGGMGIVYEGVNVDTDVPAAVKLLSVVLAEDEGVRGRFEAEIETLRRLNHPNIVRLFGFGRQDGLFFYAMELVDGSSLEEELTGGRRFQWREVTQIAIEICLALRHAHDRGVIHRDIKPGNLLMAGGGRVKLSDFGIARLFDSTAVTNAGNVLGTAEYMAPEQAAGRPVGPRADLYSLGAVLYALLAGRPLFRVRSFSELLKKQQFEKPVPLKEYAPEVPNVLEEMIHQLLEKEPDRRIPNPTILARQLKTIQQSLSLAAETVEMELPAEVPDLDATWLPDADLPESDQLGPTRSMYDDDDQSPDTSPAAPPSPALEPGDSSGKEAAADSTSSGEEETETADGRETGNHFTAVGSEELDRIESKKTCPAWLLPQTWALTAGLIALLLAGWYSLQPPSADGLYDEITARTADASIDSLLAVEDDVERFLKLYPDDQRSNVLRKYQGRIALHHYEQKLNIRTRRLGGTESLLAVEQDYIEAIDYARLDPDRAASKLQALLDLYDLDQDPASRSGKCLELARTRLARLRGRIDGQTAQRLALVQQRLDRAAKLGPTDPQRARAMYRATIELYHDKPWAIEAVRRARQSLATEEATDQPFSPH